MNKMSSTIKLKILPHSSHSSEQSSPRKLYSLKALTQCNSQRSLQVSQQQTVRTQPTVRTSQTHRQYKTTITSKTSEFDTQRSLKTTSVADVADETNKLNQLRFDKFLKKYQTPQRSVIKKEKIDNEPKIDAFLKHQQLPTNTVDHMYKELKELGQISQYYDSYFNREQKFTLSKINTQNYWMKQFRVKQKYLSTFFNNRNQSENPDPDQNQEKFSFKLQKKQFQCIWNQRINDIVSNLEVKELLAFKSLIKDDEDGNWEEKQYYKNLSKKELIDFMLEYHTEHNINLLSLQNKDVRRSLETLKAQIINIQKIYPKGRREKKSKESLEEDPSLEGVKKLTIKDLLLRHQDTPHIKEEDSQLQDEVSYTQDKVPSHEIKKTLTDLKKKESVWHIRNRSQDSKVSLLLQTASLSHLNAFLTKQAQNNFTTKSKKMIIQAYQQDDPDYFNFNNQNVYNVKLDKYTIKDSPNTLPPNSTQDVVYKDLERVITNQDINKMQADTQKIIRNLNYVQDAKLRKHYLETAAGQVEKKDMQRVFKQQTSVAGLTIAKGDNLLAKWRKDPHKNYPYTQRQVRANYYEKMKFKKRPADEDQLQLDD